MSDKKTVLIASQNKLAELINQLYVAESEFDAAIDNATNYLGNDQNREQFKDEKAESAYNRLSGIKNEIATQTKLIEQLVSEY